MLNRCCRSETTLRSHVAVCPLWKSPGTTGHSPRMPYATSTSPSHHTARYGTMIQLNRGIFQLHIFFALVSKLIIYHLKYLHCIFVMYKFSFSILLLFIIIFYECLTIYSVFAINDITMCYFYSSLTLFYMCIYMAWRYRTKNTHYLRWPQ